MRKTTLKKHLETLDESELRSEILLLFDKYKEVKNHYKLDLGTAEDRAKIYKKAKEEISKCFRTKSFVRPRRPRIKIMNSILKKMKKSVLFEHEMIDIHLHAAESATTFVIDYDFFSDTVFNAIVLNYKNAMGIIAKSKLQQEYKDRVQHLIDRLDDFHWITETVDSIYTSIYND